MAIAHHNQLLDAVRRATRVLVAFPRHAGPDAVATSLAVASIVRSEGKQVDVYADGFVVPKTLDFLPGVDAITPKLPALRALTITMNVSRAKLDELSYDLVGDELRLTVIPKEGEFSTRDVRAEAAAYRYDLVMTVDAPDLAALGTAFTDNAEFFHATPRVNIGHDAANERHGAVNYIDIAATSCAEVLYAVMSASGTHFLNPDMATLLMTGLVSKTHSFKTAAVTPRALDMASALIAAGARRDDIVQRLYRTKGISTLRLWGRALARMKYDAVTRTAWSVLVKTDFTHAGAEEREAEGVVDELMFNTPEADIVGLIYEGDAGICVLVGTEKHGSAIRLLSALKADGDRRIARLCFPGITVLEAERRVLGAIHGALGKTAPDGAVLAGSVGSVRHEERA